MNNELHISKPVMCNDDRDVIRVYRSAPANSVSIESLENLLEVAKANGAEEIRFFPDERKVGFEIY